MWIWLLGRAICCISYVHAINLLISDIVQLILNFLCLLGRRETNGIEKQPSYWKVTWNQIWVWYKYWLWTLSLSECMPYYVIEFFAPCKGIQDILGFWIPRCGFRIPDSSTVDSGFQHSGFRITKRAGFQFFTVLIRMFFFAFRFRVRILLYWNTLLECITSLFSFSIYKLWVECITVP